MKRNLSLEREKFKGKEVKGMKKGLIIGIMFMMALVFTVPVQSSILVDNWQIDLSGIDGLAAGAHIGSGNTGIKQVGFTGVSHAETVVDAGAVGPSVGDISIFDGHLSATTYVYNDGIQNGGAQFGVLNIGYSVTFDVTDVATNISVDPVTGTLTFQHLPAGTYGGEVSDNWLEIYVDNLANGGIQANTNTGDGYTDGVMVARLINPAEPTDGGTFTPLSLDGSDDATFKLNKLICPECFMLPGVFFGDTNGDGILEDLSLYDGLGNPYMASALLTDNNFDADDDNNGIPDTPAPSNWANYFPSRTSMFPGGQYASNDGSASPITQVPEPATLILVGTGLMGLGFFRRRKK